jgi:hypothetical protein
MLEPARPGAVSRDRALCLPTFSHFSIVKKNCSLSVRVSVRKHTSPNSTSSSCSATLLSHNILFLLSAPELLFITALPITKLLASGEEAS